MNEESHSNEIDETRRNGGRLATMLPGQLTTIFGTESALLHDISLTGAKVAFDNRRGIEERLEVGHELVFSWIGHEAFGQIVWTNEDTIGIEFEETLDVKVVVETRNIQHRMLEKGGIESLTKKAAREWAQGSDKR